MSTTTTVSPYSASNPQATTYVQNIPYTFGTNFVINGQSYIGTMMVGNGWWLAYLEADPYKIIRLMFQP